MYFILNLTNKLLNNTKFYLLFFCCLQGFSSDFSLCEIGDHQAASKTFRYHVNWFGKPITELRPETLAHLQTFCEASLPGHAEYPNSTKELYIWYNHDPKTGQDSVPDEFIEKIKAACSKSDPNQNIDIKKVPYTELLEKEGIDFKTNLPTIKKGLDFLKNSNIYSGFSDILRPLMMFHYGGCYFDISSKFSKQIIWEPLINFAGDNDFAVFETTILNVNVDDEKIIPNRSFNQNQESNAKEFIRKTTDPNYTESERLQKTIGYRYGSAFFNNNFMASKIKSKTARKIIDHTVKNLDFFNNNPILKIFYSDYKIVDFPNKIKTYPVFNISGFFFDLVGPYSFSYPLYGDANLRILSRQKSGIKHKGGTSWKKNIDSLEMVFGTHTNLLLKVFFYEFLLSLVNSQKDVSDELNEEEVSDEEVVWAKESIRKLIFGPQLYASTHSFKEPLAWFDAQLYQNMLGLIKGESALINFDRDTGTPEGQLSFKNVVLQANSLYQTVEIKHVVKAIIMKANRIFAKEGVAENFFSHALSVLAPIISDSGSDSFSFALHSLDPSRNLSLNLQKFDWKNFISTLGLNND